MLPSQPPFPPSSATTPEGPLSFQNLDPLAAKQMAALHATNLAKAGNRYAPGGVSSASYFGGLSSHHLPRPESVEPNPSQPPPQAMNVNANPAVAMQLATQQRRKQFLYGLANLMLNRNVPLPPQFTGMPYPPNYDPSASPWRSLDVSPTDIGIFRLAGKEIDLYKLWGFVQQSGGSAKLNQQAAWGNLLGPLELPDQFPQPNGAFQSTAAVLQNYYTLLLGPFEEAYRKNNARDPQRMQARPSSGFPVPGAQGRPGPMGGMPGAFPPSMGNGSIQVPDLATTGPNMPFSAPPTPMRQHSQQHVPGLGGTPEVSLTGSRRQDASGIPSAAGLLPDSNGTADTDSEARKRKIEEGEEANGKRARQKTGEPPDLRTTATTTRTIRQPSRRRIEYVPYARELESAGGRDLEAIQREYAMISRYPVKDFNEWGQVDMEALALSLRSRLSVELSYALTTYTFLTLLRMAQGSSFTVAHAPDLFEELLDLVEDVAFADEEDEEEDVANRPIVTHRQIMKNLTEDSFDLFGSLKPKQGHKDGRRGLVQRPGDILLAALGIIRNLSVSDSSQDSMAKHERLLPLLLRLASLKCGTSDTPLSPALSLNDFVPLRKDILQILFNIGPHVALSSSNKRDAVRAFELFASYLVDPSDSISPFNFALQTTTGRPSVFLDVAMDGFARVCHPDSNRLVLSKAVPESWLWSLFEALVHRLPVDNNDYSLLSRAEWLGYTERVVMLLYSLAFLAPPAFKQRVKIDRHLALAKVFLRLIRKMTVLCPNDYRAHYQVIVRRAVETLKLIDDAEDSFEVSPSTMPTLAFGMGYGEQGEAHVEKGMGLFSGYQDDITWGVMMMPQGFESSVFSELSSLVRVQPAD